MIAQHEATSLRDELQLAKIQSFVEFQMNRKTAMTIPNHAEDTRLASYISASSASSGKRSRRKQLIEKQKSNGLTQNSSKWI